MVYIEGHGLRDKIASGPLKLDDAIDIAIQISEGSRAAHERGMEHRSIKSANVEEDEDGRGDGGKWERS